VATGDQLRVLETWIDGRSTQDEVG
jgi:hypothetical protein